MQAFLYESLYVFLVWSENCLEPFCSVPFLGLTHSHRAFRAGKTLVRSNKRVMGGKKTKKIRMDIVRFELGIFRIKPI